MKPVYLVGGALVVGAWLALGLLVARGPQPEIVVPAELLWKAGPLNITNTLFTAWVVMAFLIIVSFLATRSMKMMPSGLQNFIEAVIAFLVGQVEDIAGEKNGRRFFMVVATIFLFIICSNWFGLFPFFNAIGKTEDVGHEVFLEIAEKQAHGEHFEKTEKFAGVKAGESSGMVVFKSGAKTQKFDIESGTEPGQALDEYIVFLATKFAGYKPEASGESAHELSKADVEKAKAALDADPRAPKLLLAADGEHGTEDHEAVPSPALGVSFTGVDFPGDKLTLVVPFFRGVYSDVNNTLALGIVAFLCIEFWGFQALGFRYLGKFINVKSPIGAFVGFLELLSEFIRVISFTFRLFGNIFAGEVLVLMLTFLMPFLVVDLIYGLELFVGFIQAAVFALLTLVFAVGASEHHGEDEHGEAEGHDGGHGGHETGAVQAH